MKMKAAAGIVATTIVMSWALAMLGLTGRAKATPHYATSGATVRDVVWIGMVDIKGAPAERIALACYDSAVNSFDHIKVLGTASGLNDDWQIHGDPSAAGTGGDALYVVASDGTTPSGYCSNLTTFETGSWNRLVYSGRYLDLYGDGGNETLMMDGGGANNTWLNGDAGDDFLQQSSSIGYAKGGDGADNIWGLTGGNGDSLSGDAGNDCLWDDNNNTTSFLFFDCGAGSGDVCAWGNRATGTTCKAGSNCETPSVYCGFF